MGFKDSFKNLFIIDEDEFEEEEFEEEVAEKPKRESIVKRRAVVEEPEPVKAKEPQKKATSGFSLTSSSAMKLVLVQPKGIDECKTLVDNLKGRRPVIVNLENIETVVARQIFDFLSGAVYALNGNVQKIANNVFVFAPESVDVGGASVKSSKEFNFGDSDSWR